MNPIVTMIAIDETIVLDVDFIICNKVVIILNCFNMETNFMIYGGIQQMLQKL